MKRFGVFLVWAMAALLLVAVSVTAMSDRLALVPLTTEAITTTSTTRALTVNLNTATAEELQQLEGVGEVLSGRIIAYRETHGNFRSVEDLLDVQGVGQARLEKWRPYLTV